MSANRVLTALRNDLEAHGLIRRPGTPPGLPPLHIEPRDGPPAPGDREADEAGGELVVTLRLGGELAETPRNAYRRRVVADVLYRSTGTAGLKAGRDLDAAIRARLVERDDPLGFVLDQGGALPTFVLDAQVYGGLSPLSHVAGVRTDIAKYLLETFSSP